MNKETNLRLTTRLTLTLIMILLTTICVAQFGGGDGTENNPYQIETAEHLNAIRGDYLVAGNHFIQTANINLGVAPWNEDEGWEPLSSLAQRFRCTYDGDNYTIYGLTINRNANYQSLFGYGDGASLTGVQLRDVNINAVNFTGALLGYANRSTIENCSAIGVIKGSQTIGGIVGNALFTNISGCFTAGKVIGTGTTGGVGGIVSTLGRDSSMIYCYSNSMIQGQTTRIGGLAGRIEVTINDCYSTGAIVVIGETGNVGGIVGECKAGTRVNRSFWNTETSGRVDSPGGGTGIRTLQMTSRNTFQNGGWELPETWNIIDGETYPFLAWEEGPSFHNKPGPYNLVGDENFGAREISLEWEMLGNPIGYDVYRDDELLRRVNHPARETVDEDLELFVDYTYYAVAVYEEDGDELVSAPSNAIKIVLTPSFDNGDGTANDPYQVADESQLDMVRYFMDAHFVQTEDLDLSRTTWNPIGDSDNRFRGTYNGNGLSIVDMRIETLDSLQGLFGFASGATFQNITLENVNLRMGSYSGALVGRAENTSISNVHVIGRIEGTGIMVGGLVGQATSTTHIISNCSASGTLTSSSKYLGGLMGKGYMTIDNCWTDLEITTADTHAGGILGAQDSTTRINRCAVHGNITSVSPEANLYLGGLVGSSYLTYIADSYVTGNVLSSAEGRRDYVGGLIGGSTSTTYTVLRSYTTGSVTGRNYVGGLIGAAHSPNATSIEDCYSTGTIIGVDYVGGLIGSIDNKAVLRCYSISRVLGNTNVGGLIGNGEGEITNSYWNTQTSGQEESPGGGLPRNTEQMSFPYGENTYVEWSFNTVWSHDVDPSWNGGYPRLSYQLQPPPEVLDTPQLEVDIVQIGGVNHFRIRWEPVERARSYKIFASQKPHTTNWGEPVRIVGEDVAVYTEPVGNNVERFFYITASYQDIR